MRVRNHFERVLPPALLAASQLLLKNLIEAIVQPALEGYLANKPACCRIPLTAHPEDVTIIVNSEVVDGKAPAKNYVDLDLTETTVIIILPQWAQDIIYRVPSSPSSLLPPLPLSLFRSLSLPLALQPPHRPLCPPLRPDANLLDRLRPRWLRSWEVRSRAKERRRPAA